MVWLLLGFILVTAIKYATSVQMKKLERRMKIVREEMQRASANMKIVQERLQEAQTQEKTAAVQIQTVKDVIEDLEYRLSLNKEAPP